MLANSRPCNQIKLKALRLYKRKAKQCTFASSDSGDLPSIERGEIQSKYKRRF